jgi:hypothetical protein
VDYAEELTQGKQAGRMRMDQRSQTRRVRGIGMAEGWWRVRRGQGSRMMEDRWFSRPRVRVSCRDEIEADACLVASAKTSKGDGVSLGGCISRDA